MNITIDNDSREPIYSQIVSQVKLGIASGKMLAGHKLPSVREMAKILSLNANTIARAYSELERDGVVRSRRGHGTFVTETVKALTREERERFVRDKSEALIAEAKRIGMSKRHLMTELIRVR